MPGIYIHIPFCKKACHYCNFHFSTSLKSKDDFIKALIKEMELRQDYLLLSDGTKPRIGSVYFGGGTPSLLSASEITLIFEALHRFYQISPDAEITLEANPDDLTRQKLKELKATLVNRFSVGVQSFVEEDLLFMNRSHTAGQALDAIKSAQDTGFNNLTIDLIYGTPTLSMGNWEKNLQTFFQLAIPHLSCYCLTVEEKTALASFVKKKQVKEMDEELAIGQFQLLISRMREKGYEQYEISNFCKDDCYSRHNSNYWKKEHYLGLGPSAHSFNGDSRQWNVSNNALYIRSINENRIPFEREELTPNQRYNEYILTTLRTKWGTDAEKVKTEFGEEFYHHLLKEIHPYLKDLSVIQKDATLYLTDRGKLLADKITSDLFSIGASAV